MNENFDTSYQNQYVGNSIIERGYDIYDEWIDNGSRKRQPTHMPRRYHAYLRLTYGSRKNTVVFCAAFFPTSPGAERCVRLTL